MLTADPSSRAEGPTSQERDDECLDPVRSTDSNEKRLVVFVSSTFRDMVAERDELAIRIFPEIRAICEARGITWGEVDLRWGIPPEKEQEQVLEICLQFIDRCRPNFIGMLGERYGRTDIEVTPSLRRKFPRLEDEQGRSVTELEIQHGVLNDPAMADHAFFYFRDPAYIETLAEDQRQGFRESPTPEDQAAYGEAEAERLAAERRARLIGLKTRIRESGLPVRENYPGPVAFGQLVRADLMRVIDSLAPLPSERITDEDREDAGHEAFARSRFGVYIPRQAYFDELDAHALSDGPPLIITGESGSGKSALLTHWTDRYSAHNPKAVVIRHFVGATADSADLTAMLRRFMGECRRQLGIQQEIPKEDAALRAAFPIWLSMAAAKGRVVLVIDGLNQLEDRHGALELTWLPPVVPANIRLVVSMLPGKSLAEIRKRRWPELEVEPLTIDERKQVISCYLRRFFRELSPGEIDRIAATEQASNPLFLRAVLEELRLHGEFGRLPEQITAYLAIPTIPMLFEAILARYERDYERDRPGLVRDLCRLVWASRRGLSRDELRDLLGFDGTPLPDAYWAPLLLAMQQGLVEKGDVLTFFHDYLREAVRHRYLSEESEVMTAHTNLSNYFQGQILGPRKLEELPWQLASNGMWEQLAHLLTEPTFFLEEYSTRKYDTLQYWVQIENSSSLRCAKAYAPTLREITDEVYLNSVALLLMLLGHPGDALRIWDRIISITRDPKIRLVAIGNKANILKNRGDLEGALILLEEKERICRESSNEEGLQATLGNRAGILRVREDLDGALCLLEEQEQICSRLGNRDCLSTIWGNRAALLIARKHLTDLDDAMALLKRQEEICRSEGNLTGLSLSLSNQSLIFMLRDDPDGAMILLEELEGICRTIGNSSILASSLGINARVLKDRGDFDGALMLLKQEEQIYREIEHPDRLQINLSDQAVILRIQWDLDAALGCHAEEECICRNLGKRTDLAISLLNQTLVFLLQGRRIEAFLAINEAYLLALRIGSATLERQARGILDRVQLHQLV